MKKPLLFGIKANRFRARRWRQHLRRNVRIRKRQLRTQQHHQSIARNFGQKSKILTLLEANATNHLKVERGIHVTIPKVFSILDAPEVVVDTISKFAAVKLSGKRPSYVYIDQAKMETYDLAASALLDLAAVELKKELQLNKRPGKFEGRFPKYGRVAKFIKSIGIVKHLGIKGYRPNWLEEKSLRVFDRRSRHYFLPKSAKSTTKKDRTVEGFVKHLNECLSTQNKELTNQGEINLASCLVELLDNAEQHAKFNDWSLLGYLDLEDKKLIIEIAIINFGQSFAETFLSLPTDHFAWRHVRPYLKKHLSARNIINAPNERDLITVMALQPLVSSKNSDSSSSRGHGTVQLLRFFKRVQEACTGSTDGARMALLTGSTYIRFDDTPGLKEALDEDFSIGFNETNSLLQKPDRRFVRNLGKINFPGTIISIRFPLAPSMVQSESTYEQKSDH